MKPRTRSAVLVALALLAGAALARAEDGAALLKAQCAACHLVPGKEGFSRIDAVRKTPEGWQMTIARMIHLRGLKIAEDEQKALVKHLADSRGLAPAEARPWRYILERRPNVIETFPDEELSAVCARCHSYAQVGLERRDEEEWRLNAHFHLGQWPSLEYHSRARDRNWWELASGPVSARLAKMYPLETKEWSAWAKRPKRDLAGRWRVVGRRPGLGAYEGTLEIEGKGGDRYGVKMAIRPASGEALAGTGEAIVYTGYEWRASVKLGKEETRQVFALSEDGESLVGRWYVLETDSLGGDLHAERVAEKKSRVLAIDPPHLKTGAEAEVRVHGVGLDGKPDLGAGVEVVETRSATPETVTVLARAKGDAHPGLREVRVGDASAKDLLAVYSSVDFVRVEPDYGIARVGGGGGPIPPVPTQFEAIAWANGRDGKPETADDLRIGPMPARWSVEDRDEVARELEDAKYAGTMGEGGLFLPAAAGPNPKRRFKTNNAGDLTVKALVRDGERVVEGSGHLIVTLQVWRDPPIR